MEGFSVDLIAASSPNPESNDPFERVVQPRPAEPVRGWLRLTGAVLRDRLLWAGHFDRHRHQASGLLLTAFVWLMPLGVVLLVGSLVYLVEKIDLHGVSASA